MSEGGGLEATAAPPGKSFRFVRACERAGARAARDQIDYGYLEVFAKRTSPSSSSRGLLFHFCDPKKAQNVSRLTLFALFYILPCKN